MTGYDGKESDRSYFEAMVIRIVFLRFIVVLWLAYSFLGVPMSMFRSSGLLAVYRPRQKGLVKGLTTVNSL